MRSRVEGTRLEDNLFGPGNRKVITEVPATDTVQLAWGMGPVIRLTSVAAITVKLPRATADKRGGFFQIITGGTGTITLQDAAAAALSPAMTIPAGKMGEVITDGTKWSASATIAS